LIIAISIILIGASGAFLSGLLQVRGSRTTLLQYEESMIKQKLRLLIGSIVSLVSFLLLSWNALLGVVSETTGSFILIAFISGFLERYFLKLLKIETNETSDDKENDQ